MKNSQATDNIKGNVTSYVEKHQQQVKYKANILNGDITPFLAKETTQQVGVGKPQQNSSVQNFNPQPSTSNNNGGVIGYSGKKPVSHRIRSASSNKALVNQQQNNSKGLMQLNDQNRQQQNQEKVLNHVASKEKFGSQGPVIERQLSSQNNGMGLWVHQKPNVSNYSAQNQNENLPPINNKRSSQQQFNKQQSGLSQGTPVAKNLTQDIDLKVEKSMISVLEQKYQEAVQQQDKAELLMERAKFECDIAKKEKQKYLELYNQTMFDLNSLRQKNESLEQNHAELQKKAQQTSFENQKLVQQLDSISKSSESYQKLYMQEQRVRESDSQKSQIKIRELEDSLGEYEEEHMNLQNQIYQYKSQIETLMKNGKADTSMISQITSNQISPTKQKKKQAKEDFDDCFGSDENLDQNNLGGANISNIQGVDNQIDEKSKKIKELLDDMLQMRKRLKKEEEQKRQYQDIARKKEEELKKFKVDLQQIERKLQEEEGLKNREKNLVMQRDNKIKVLEDKLKQQLGDLDNNRKQNQEKVQKEQLQKAKGQMKYKGQAVEKEDKIVKTKDSDKLIMDQPIIQANPTPQYVLPNQLKTLQNQPQQKQKTSVKFADRPSYSDSDDSEEEFKLNNKKPELQPVKARPFLFGPVDDDI
eukprot:403348178